VHPWIVESHTGISSREDMTIDKRRMDIRIAHRNLSREDMTVEKNSNQAQGTKGPKSNVSLRLMGLTWQVSLTKLPP
jgi:hypothetical protein